MMNTKKAETIFNKMIHSDLKGEVFFSIEDYDFERDQGIVVFLNADFEELYRFDPKMIHHCFWYFKDPKKNYTKALNNDNPFDNVLAIIDQQTGKRTIDDWKDDKNEMIQFFYQLRKKFQD